MTLLPHRKNDACISKGQRLRIPRVRAKVSIVTTNTLCPGGQCVLHAKPLSDNRYDGHTLREAIEDVRALVAKSNAAILIRAAVMTPTTRAASSSQDRNAASASSNASCAADPYRARDRPSQSWRSSWTLLSQCRRRRNAIRSPWDISLHPRLAVSSRASLPYPVGEASPKMCPLDVSLAPRPADLDRYFLDFRTSAGVFDLNRQNIVAQKFRRRFVERDISRHL